MVAFHVEFNLTEGFAFFDIIVVKGVSIFFPNAGSCRIAPIIGGRHSGDSATQ